uniref:Cytochrome P450 mono-oxygenase n=1 Tax=Osmia rufa TaxID=1437190 RepID=A0A411K6X4_OSMRU|nr:cytochrome P450 mono-oxygenase [Osmia bicornis]
MIWTIIVASVVVLAIYHFTSKRYAYFEERGIPYLKAFPFLGSLWKVVLMRASFAATVQQMYNLYSEAKYVGCFDFLTPVILLRDPELIKSVMIKNFDHFPEHRNLSDNADDTLFSKNLFSLNGERWKEVRSMLSPAFTTSKMRSMFVLMKECAKRYGENLASLQADQTILELKDTFTRYTNDVIATCAFGVSVDSMTYRENKFYLYGREASTFGLKQSLKFFFIRSFPRLCRMLKITLLRKGVSDFFKDLIESTIKTRDEQGIVRPDMLQLMMEFRDKGDPSKELTLDDMIAQAFVFFLAGFESTATLMCFTTHEVGVNEEVQKRLQDEIDQVLTDCNGNVTYEAINGMKYLDAIVNEGLRKYPVSVAGDRVCRKPFELPPTLPNKKPYVVKEGEIVSIPFYGIQHDPKYYPEPEKFDPDRFYDDPKQILNSGTFLTFGLGPRMCIGNRFAILETKTLLFYVFANCTLKRCSKTIVPMKLSKQGLAMTPEGGGYWFEIQPRAKGQSLIANGDNDRK